MSELPQLYPLRLTPIYQYRLWGGRHFEALLSEPLPPKEPIGEAWILSDRDDHASTVAAGALAGQTIKELIEQFPTELLGRFAGRYSRFPLLLKFLDARDMLSVQVHPSSNQPELLPPGEAGKTEAWVVLSSKPGSRIYAGLKPGTTADDLRRLDRKSSNAHLASFEPQRGDALFIPAGTVHALGGGVVVFEVQQNSDVTFRLFDWDRVDAQTGKPRELHIEKAIQSTDFSQGELRPVSPVFESSSPVIRERLFHCEHFTTWRATGNSPFDVGASNEPRVITCIEGAGQITAAGSEFPIRMGDTFLLPASFGVCRLSPTGSLTVLETALPRFS